MPYIVVINPGILSTIQDAGRFGFQKYGIPPSGAMDDYALRIANLLVGNRKDEAVLEITSSDEMTFDGDVRFAVTGGDLGPTLNGKNIVMWQIVEAHSGDVLKFTGPKIGFRSYLSAQGGIDVKEILGSKSTCLVAKFGGYKGRKLENGDIIKIGKNFKKVRSIRASDMIMDYHRKNIRVIIGPQEEKFPQEALNLFLSQKYKLMVESDRMGYRFDGAKLHHEISSQMLSNGVITGTIQVAGDGLPLVMMVDHQTTGGYPKIATAISVDIPILGQLKPGDEVSFESIDFETARKLYLERERKIINFEYELLNVKSTYYNIRVDGKKYNVEIKENNPK